MDEGEEIRVSAGSSQKIEGERVWSSSLVAGAPHFKCGDVGCQGFEPLPLHKLCNVSAN